MVIVVGVTGGIAAYKAVQLVRLLTGDGHDVHVVPTEDALRFVGLPTWEAISRNRVTTSVHEDVAEVRHVALGQRADLVVVAPATANTLAGMAAGLASDLLGTTLLATTAPVLVAPAMHTEMWQHPATRANMRTLESRGVHVIGPEDGPLAGGDSGPGRMSEPEAVHAAARSLLRPRQDLRELRIAVSAGGTREPIDPVRFIGNRSSGRQGVAVALAAARRGAAVRLVACNVEADVLRPATRAGIEVTTAGTAHELRDEMEALAADSDVLVMAAAVADYRVAEVADGKLTKEGADGPPSLQFVENDDIVAGLAARRREGQTVVAFSAETGDDAVARGRRKRAKKGADLIAVNEVGWTKGFETGENRLVIVGPDDEILADVEGSKDAVSEHLLDAVLTVRKGR